MLGPPIGGALYSRFGFRGPFIFGAIFALVDLLGRFVIIERKDALKWGHDPFTPNLFKTETTAENVAEKSVSTVEAAHGERNIPSEITTPPVKQLSFFAVMAKLAKSPRAVAASIIIFLYGFVGSGTFRCCP